MSASLKRYEVEKEEKWMDACREVPFIAFKAEWEVKVIPPFNGAMSRFIVRKKGSEKATSVYLDCSDALGCVGQPYWEVYPVNGDTERFLIDDAEGLMKGIEQSISQGSREL